MSSSTIKTKRAVSVWQFCTAITAIYLIGLFLAHHDVQLEKAYWSGYKLVKLNEADEWVAGDRFNIGKSDRIQRLRFTVHIDDSEKWQRPVSLVVGGPFTAQIYWDGEEIGNKGKAGLSPQEEKTGPIDSISYIPTRLLSSGKHIIDIHLSTQRLFLEDDSVFHHIYLGPYRESGRRDLRYYATPLIILGALVILSLQSLRIGNNAGNALHTGLGIYGICIIFLLLSEVSRAVVNYPYHFHELRGMVGWISNIGAGLALIYTTYQVSASKQTRLILLVGLFVFLVSHFLSVNSGDKRMALNFVLLVLGPAIVFFVAWFKKGISYLSTLPFFFMASCASVFFSAGLFLDSFQFIASLILIGGAWAWVYVDVKANEQKTPTMEKEAHEFVVRSSNESRTVSTKECYALKGEGNYTALLLADGTSVLHQDGIGALMDSSPTGFVRIHKSFAVNLDYVVKLKSAPGSKYWLEMRNQTSIPVSRYRVAELRSLLEKSSA